MSEEFNWKCYSQKQIREQCKAHTNNKSCFVEIKAEKSFFTIRIYESFAFDLSDKRPYPQFNRMVKMIT